MKSKWAILLIYFAFHIGNISASLKPRIIGGENADIKEFPFIASICMKGDHFCGGTIIGPRHVLTAGHCFSRKLNRKLGPPPYADVTVHTGTSSSRDIGHLHRIVGVKIHPGWDLGSPNDLAIVTLADEIVFDEKQQKAELPKHDVVTGTTAYVTGWGSTSTSTTAGSSVQLQKLKTTILDKPTCQATVNFNLYDDNMCTVHAPGRGFCRGDSGGPLVVNNQVVGVVSWVQNQQYATGIPEIYTNVYAHRFFILSEMIK